MACTLLKDSPSPLGLGIVFYIKNFDLSSYNACFPSIIMLCILLSNNVFILILLPNYPHASFHSFFLYYGEWVWVLVNTTYSLWAIKFWPIYQIWTALEIGMSPQIGDIVEMESHHWQLVTWFKGPKLVGWYLASWPLANLALSPSSS